MQLGYQYQFYLGYIISKLSNWYSTQSAGDPAEIIQETFYEVVFGTAKLFNVAGKIYAHSIEYNSGTSSWDFGTQLENPLQPQDLADGVTDSWGVGEPQPSNTAGAYFDASTQFLNSYLEDDSLPSLFSLSSVDKSSSQFIIVCAGKFTIRRLARRSSFLWVNCISYQWYLTWSYLIFPQKNYLGACDATCQNTVDGTVTLEDDYGEVCKNDGICETIYGAKPTESGALTNMLALLIVQGMYL